MLPDPIRLSLCISCPINLCSFLGKCTTAVVVVIVAAAAAAAAAAQPFNLPSSPLKCLDQCSCVRRVRRKEPHTRSAARLLHPHTALPVFTLNFLSIPPSLSPAIVFCSLLLPLGSFFQNIFLCSALKKKERERERERTPGLYFMGIDFPVITGSSCLRRT